VKELITELTGSLPFVIALVLVAVGLLVLLLLVLLNRARDAASYADLATVEAPPAGSPGENALQVLDLRSAPTEAEMATALARALRLMGDYLPGKGARYQVPWLLSLGQAGAGKTTLLGNTGLRPPFGEPEGPSPTCLWWLFDRAVVLDVSGDLVLRLDGASSDQPSWHTLLRLVRKARRRRPVDAVLLSLPVTQLLAYDAADTASLSALAHQAELLRARLQEVRSSLGFAVPVYTLVTQCDRLPGFGDFAADLDPGQTDQMFGWSVRTSPDVAYSDSWVDDAFTSITGALDRHQLRALREGLPLTDPQAFLALPAVVGGLREALRIFWNQIFAGGKLDEALPARGLYLVGGQGFADDGRDAHPPAPTSAGYRSFEGAQETGRHREVDFVADLIGQKVLFEWSLARPVPLVQRMAHLQRGGLQACLLAALLLGPLALWRGYAVTAQEADALRTKFLIPARCALQRTPDLTRLRDPRQRDRLRKLHGEDNQLRADAIQLLSSVSQVPGYTLRTVYLPPSWWNRYAAPIRDTALDAYSRVIFPALAIDIQQQLERVARWRPEPHAALPVYDFSSVPEFKDLVSYVGQLGDLDRRIRLYNSMIPNGCGPDETILPADFQELVRGFDDKLKVEPPDSAASYYSELLCDAKGPEFVVDPPLKKELQNRALQLSAEASRHLFEEGVLVLDLDRLQAQVDDLARNVPPPGSVHRVYSDLLATIQQTKTDLARPEVARTGGHFDPTSPLRLLMATKKGKPDEKGEKGVAGNDILGAGVEADMEKQWQDAFAKYKLRLAAYSTDATGPLLAQKDREVQLQLSQSILGLEAALQALLNRYAQPRQGTRLTLAAPAGTFLAWNSQTLQQGVDLATSYQAFMGKSFNGYPGFQQIVNQASQEAVEPNVLDLVVQGQSFPALPGLSSRELRESHLQRQVDNLTQAAAQLNALLGFLRKPPPVSGCAGTPSSAYCQLGRCLLAQQQSLLQQLDALLADQRLYAPAAGAFASWNGGAAESPAWRAFGVKDAAGLTAYVTNQRRIVQALASRYATPILTAVPLGTDVGGTSTVPLRRWKLILADLTDYQNKVPENALLTLESYITGSLATATAANCLALPAPADSCFAPSTPADLAASPTPCDLFLEARNRLQKDLQPRCAELNYRSGEAAYARLKEEFDQRLAGKFPFTASKTSAGGDAKPADLDLFFAAYDAEAPAVRQLLAAAGSGSLPSPWPAATRDDVAAFLDQLQTVRSFFSTFLDRKKPAKATTPAGTPAPAAPRVPDVPALGLQVSFRPFPAAEQGGNEVIARSLKAGQVSLSSGGSTSATPPLWLYGTPVEVALRWAQDSLAVPTAVSQAIEEGQLQVGERTATFLAQGPWSLLQLLRYGAAPELLAAGTVRLEIPVVAAPAIPGSGRKGAPSVPPPSTPARIYIKIELTSPDASQTPLAVPPFPARAPDVPALGS
jgi:type VI secretion system protein ImpL